MFNLSRICCGGFYVAVVDVFDVAVLNVVIFAVVVVVNVVVFAVGVALVDVVFSILLMLLSMWLLSM